MDDLKATVIQTPLVWGNIDTNLAAFEALLRPLAGTTDLVVLPEMFSTGFVMQPEGLSEPPDGKTTAWMAARAAELNAAICGSIIIKEGENYFNRMLFVYPDGSYRTYDKRHLFHMAGEHERYSQGFEQLTVEYKGWKIRPLICYDLRFPVWAKNTAINGQYDYDVLIYVANWPARRSHAWRSLLMARAIENQAYCIGVNRTGPDGNGIHHQGNSAILDYQGEFLVNAEENETFTGMAKLNHAGLGKFRAGFNVSLDWDKFSIEK